MLISIVIPAYNRANVISKTLDSIIAQDYQDWECIIADDHSTDNTMQILKDYALKDSRIKVFENERKKGAQGARNTAILHSAADWICIFDSDDYMYPNYLSEMTKVVASDVDIIVCHAEVVNVDTGETITVFDHKCDGDISTKIFTGECYVPNNQSIIRKNKLEEIGLLDEDCPSFQEWDTHIRLSKVANYHTIDKVLVTYYVGGNDTISSNKKREVRGRLYIYKKFKKDWYCHFVAGIKNSAYLIIYIFTESKDAEMAWRIKSLVELVRIMPIHIILLPLFLPFLLCGKVLRNLKKRYFK